MKFLVDDRINDVCPDVPGIDETRDHGNEIELYNNNQSQLQDNACSKDMVASSPSPCAVS